jgi:hypothetical protein
VTPRTFCPDSRVCTQSHVACALVRQHGGSSSRSPPPIRNQKELPLRRPVRPAEGLLSWMVRIRSLAVGKSRTGDLGRSCAIGGHGDHLASYHLMLKVGSAHPLRTIMTGCPGVGTTLGRLFSHSSANCAAATHAGVAKVNAEASPPAAWSESKTAAAPALLARRSGHRSARPARPGVASDGQPIGHLRGGIHSLDCAAGGCLSPARAIADRPDVPRSKDGGPPSLLLLLLPAQPSATGPSSSRQHQPRRQSGSRFGHCQSPFVEPRHYPLRRQALDSRLHVRFRPSRCLLAGPRGHRNGTCSCSPWTALA